MEVREQSDLQESWTKKTQRANYGENESDIMLQVSRAEYKASILIKGGMSDRTLLAIYLNSTIGVSRVYRKGLIMLVQFIPICQNQPMWNLSQQLLPSNKIMSGQRFPAKAGGQWPLLVHLQPRGVLACALGESMEWTNPAVVRDLKKLFKANNPKKVEKYIQMARKEVWVDACKGHNKFMAALKIYYS